MALLTPFFVENSNTLAGGYFFFLKKGPRPDLENCQYQIWTLAKRLGMLLSSNSNFSMFWQASFSNFRIKMCQRHFSYKNIQTNQV